MREFYLYADTFIQNIIKDIFADFKIYTLSKEDIKKNELSNKNIFFALNDTLSIDLNKDFFSKNNTVILYMYALKFLQW